MKSCKHCGHSLGNDANDDIDCTSNQCDKRRLIAERDALRAQVAMLYEALSEVAAHHDKTKGAGRLECSECATRIEDALSAAADAQLWLDEKLTEARTEEWLKIKDRVWNGELWVPKDDYDTRVATEARAAALEEAAKHVELNWTFDRPAGGYMQTPNGDRARRIAVELRAITAKEKP